MKKKSYIIPVVEQEESSMFTALCASNKTTGAPGDQNDEPGTLAPKRRVF